MKKDMLGIPFFQRLANAEMIYCY